MENQEKQEQVEKRPEASENTVSQAGTASSLQIPSANSLTPTLSLSLTNKLLRSKKIKGYHFVRQQSIEEGKMRITERLDIDELTDTTDSQNLLNEKIEAPEVTIENYKARHKTIKAIIEKIPILEKIIIKILEILIKYGH